MTQKTSQGDDLLDQLTSDSRQTRQIARRRMIAEAVMSEGSMRIEDLTDRFGISLMTAIATWTNLSAAVSSGRRAASSLRLPPIS
ncbi:hypothetical protein AJ87_39850 [Rhizobium yanglingense]|nr:hypothetical protein AJ87_39850 [Rhizobium yanglingense]